MKSETAGDVFALMETLRKTRIREFRLEAPGFKFHAVKHSPSDPPSAADAEPRLRRELRPIVAPRLGIFSRSETPEAPVAAAPGQSVGEEDVVGFLRVLEKTYPVASGVSGIIERICVADGTMVEFKQPLFLVSGEDRV